MWLFFALLSGGFYTVHSLITRHLLKKEGSDAWAFSFYFSMVGALVSFPFMMADFKVATTPTPWVVLILVGALIVVHNFLNISSSKFVAPSVSGSITKFRLIWVMLLGIVILHESSGALKLIGTALTVLSGIVVVGNLSKQKNVKGVLYAFSATIFYAIVIVSYKYLFSHFNPQSLTFFIFCIPMILNLFIMPRSIHRIRALVKDHLGMILLGCGFGAFANLAMNQGLLLGETSRVLVVIEGFLVLTLVGEHIVLGERENHIAKVVAVICATIGAVLMRVG